MNNMKWRLTDLLLEMDIYDERECRICKKAFCDNDCFAEKVAEYLIANGVTMQELSGCKYCEEYEGLPEHFVNGKPVGKVFDTAIQTDENGLWHIETCSVPGIGIKFCPMCGRRLPQPPKAELQRIAPFICCPICDEDECVGRNNCNEIKRFIENRLKEREQGGC